MFVFGLGENVTLSHLLCGTVVCVQLHNLEPFRNGMPAMTTGRRVNVKVFVRAHPDYRSTAGNRNCETGRDVEGFSFFQCVVVVAEGSQLPENIPPSDGKSTRRGKGTGMSLI